MFVDIGQLDSCTVFVRLAKCKTNMYPTNTMHMTLRNVASTAMDNRF